MAKKQAIPKTPTPFELMARRVKTIITSPRAQLECRANIAREPHESQEDWQMLLEQIGEAEEVRMTNRDDGSVHLAWIRHKQD
ncbi:hypothetical protein M2318_004877 [Metapseudomonas resinovorans]|uniref:DUF1654 domain-containing protein n=1 Tax=Metapseudomonas resinovorans TaxID=53412 RepID=UPI003D1F2CAF